MAPLRDPPRGAGLWRVPLLWGALAALSAFAAAALGLAGSGAGLTAWQYLWTAVASLVPGILAGAKVRLMNVDAVRSRRELADVRARVMEIAAELYQRAQDDEAERGTTAVTLSQLGATLARLVSGGLVGNDHEIREASAGFAQTVIEALHEVLGGATGRHRGPVRVLFLQYRSSRDDSLGRPLPKPGGAAVVFTAQWAVGHRTPVTWDIRADEDDAETAERIMARRPPWGRGTLLIDDVGKPEYAGGYCVLLPPDDGVASYCRIAVSDEQRHYGILCLDAWEAGALTAGDEAVAASFGVLLTAGLSVAATLTGGASRSQRPRSDGRDQPALGA